MGKLGGGQASAPQRNIEQEVNQTMSAYSKNVLPQGLRLSSEYGPQLTALNTQLQGQALQGGVNNIQNVLPALQQTQMSTAMANPLYASMYNSALSQMGAGGSLTPDEQRLATQSGLQGWASRGLSGSPGGLINAALSRTNYSQQRYQQRLSNAGTVLNGFSGMSNPYGVGGGILSSAYNTVSGNYNSNIDPFNSYAQDVYSSNQNAKANAANSQRNFTGGIIGGVLGAAGSIFGA